MSSWHCESTFYKERKDGWGWGVGGGNKKGGGAVKGTRRKY